MGRPAAPIEPVELASLARLYSDEEIALRLGFARVTVTAARKRHSIPSFTEYSGLKRRDGNVTFGGRRKKHLFNEGFFRSISCEASAYFLGLIAADGNLDKTQTKLELQLAEPDHHILHDFLACIGAEGCKVSPRRRADREKTFHRITLCSKAMGQDLVSWGITPDKTEAMQLRRAVPKEWLRHFVRGFWDGDGSVGRNHFEVGIRSEAFALQLKEMITDIGGEIPPFRQSRTRKGEPFYIMAVASRRFYAFRNALYHDCSVRFKRKHASYVDHWC